MNDIRKSVTLHFIVGILKRAGGAYGYDLWLPDNVTEHDLLWQCAIEILKSEPPSPYTPPSAGMRRVMTLGEDSCESKVAKEIFPLASDILWLLCIRGILRLGVRNAGGQSVDRGQGYSLTLKGREWVNTYSEGDLQELCASL